VLDALSPARRRLVLLVAAGATLGVVLVASLVAVRLSRDRVRPVSQADPGPVLLVSGYGGSTRSLEPLRRALQAAGRDVVVVPPVQAGTGDITTQAAALGRRARAAARRFSSPSVDVVGYSAGGVVARAWVRDYGGASLARRVLSLGSPQHGTDLAELAVGIGGRCPAACRQLEPDSTLLRRLNARDETPRGPRFVSVWSTADQVVIPPGSARLAGALDFTVQSVCPGARTQHGDLPSDPVVLAALRTTLGEGPAHPPTGVRC
jgi:triacylglycerol esterase/lipase EstA (alpha/beta hydrolase family)